MLGAVVLAAVLPAWAPPRPASPRAAVRSAAATAATASRWRHAAVRAQQQQQLSLAQLAEKVVVDIATTGINSRCITASIVVGTGVDEVWQILTDYDNLASHVPNLVVSETRPHPTGGTRIYQEGAQKIIGFDFRAALTMDMTVRLTARSVSPVSGFPPRHARRSPPLGGGRRRRGCADADRRGADEHAADQVPPRRVDHVCELRRRVARAGALGRLGRHARPPPLRAPALCLGGSAPLVASRLRLGLGAIRAHHGTPGPCSGARGALGSRSNSVAAP